MTACTHEQLVEGYYGHDCAVCGELVYPYGSEPWAYLTPEEEDALAREEAAYTDGRCETCGGEWGDGWSTCQCEGDDDGPYCEHCGEALDREECDVCGGEGEYDAYELDPLWYDPGDTERCEQCGGDGGWWQCTNRACSGKRDGHADAA